MKKLGFLLIFCLFLTGCGTNIPMGTAQGLEWNDDWVSVGGIVGVDTPAGLDERENNDTLSMNGMYYATWSAGEPEAFVNEDGNDAEIYDAQIYLLLAGFKDVAETQGTAAAWIDLASERYDVESTKKEAYNGQEFTVMTYRFNSDTNPYSYGASAFGVYRNYAISVELSCREGFAGDAESVLAEFLENCHYSA